MIIFDRQLTNDPAIEAIRLERKYQLGPYRKPSNGKSAAEAPERRPSVAKVANLSPLRRRGLATLAAA